MNSYTAAFYLGLVDGATTPTFAAADSAASHAGWTENTGYTTPANRGTAAWSAAASGASTRTAAESAARIPAAVRFPRQRTPCHRSFIFLPN